MNTKCVKLPCPICQTLIQWDTKNLFRPFCSERCKIIDLGAWSDNTYQIKGSSILKENDNP